MIFCQSSHTRLRYSLYHSALKAKFLSFKATLILLSLCIIGSDLDNLSKQAIVSSPLASSTLHAIDTLSGLLQQRALYIYTQTLSPLVQLDGWIWMHSCLQPVSQTRQLKGKFKGIIVIAPR